MRAMGDQNGQLRAALGAGSPGLYTLLGGWGNAPSGGNPGTVGASSRFVPAFRDVRVSGGASGGSLVGGSGGSKSSGGGPVGGPPDVPGQQQQ